MKLKLKEAAIAAAAVIMISGAGSAPVTRVSAADANTNAVYRLYNPNSGEHFYTINAAEKANLYDAGWYYEGIGWYAPKGGNDVFRLYNPNAGEHMYTTSYAEKANLVRAGWRDEGTCWKSSTSRLVPLYRVYNPNGYANNHHYTTAEVEKDSLVKAGWKSEGTAWYAAGKGQLLAHAQHKETPKPQPATQPVQPQQSQPSASQNATYFDSGSGVLSIPAIGVNLPVYFAASETWDPDTDTYTQGVDPQTIVDRWNSGYITEYDNNYVVSDHASQGFSAINNCSVGNTVAYLTLPDGTRRTYRCSGYWTAYNNGAADGYNNKINGADAWSHQFGDLILQTCLNGSGAVDRIVGFMQIG